MQNIPPTIGSGIMMKYRTKFADYTLQEHQETRPLYDSAAADFGDS